MSERQIPLLECGWCQKSRDLCDECKIRDHEINGHTPTETRLIGIICWHNIEDDNE